jgi:hypothetical protein|tara:strand:+ start:161 stop:391 length:231 start_codon:yes stop_codon:yes gene_type:complete
MRISYDNGELNLSLTNEEVEHISSNKGKAVKMDISWLKVLHEDISKCVMAHWSKVEVWDALESHQKTFNSKSKSKK